MEIKKTAKGWEYDGVVFTDEMSAEAARSATLESAGHEIESEKLEARLIYDNERPTSFGLFVTAHLKQSGCSIARLATDLGVSRQTIFDWINAKSIPTRKNVEAILALTSCSPETLRQALHDNFETQKAKLFENLLAE